jgi:flavodoxin
MNILILYDSKFGNTEKLAVAMQGAVANEHRVSSRAVVGAPTDASGYDLVLVGGPTHAHGASQPLKDALKQLPSGSLRGVPVAVFDTRFRMPRALTGSAAGVAAKLLKKAGAEIVDSPQSFFVTRGNPPELDPGEDVRAGTWAHDVAARVDPRWVAPV